MAIPGAETKSRLAWKQTTNIKRKVYSLDNFARKTFLSIIFILHLVPLEERWLVIELFPYRKFWGKAMGVLLGRMAQTSSIVLRFLVTYVSSTGLNLIPNICSNRSVASTSCSPMGMAPP